MGVQVDLDALPDQRPRGADYPDVVPGRVAQIDADFMAYQVSAESADELSGLKPRKTLDQMKKNCRNGLEHLQRLCGAERYIAHITPSGSDKGGRDAAALTKEYQGNRKGKEKPHYLQAIRHFIGEELPSIVHLSQEADDGMSQANYEAAILDSPDLSVIVSRDKDLRMAPGLHWDFEDEVIVDVDDTFGHIWVDRSKSAAKLLGWGTKFFWAQLLMGDAADNIAGLPHMIVKDKIKPVGPIAAFKLLEGCTTDKECFDLHKKLWAECKHEWVDYRDGRETTWQQHMIADMKLLWMRRYKSEDDVIQWLREML